MSGIRLDMRALRSGIERMENRSDMAIRAFAETGALKMQSYAQQHAKWTDRSGRARQTLQGGVEKHANGYTIRLAYGVDYGIHLELRYGKRYAILPDTIRIVGQEEIMPAFQNLMERL